MSTFVVESNNFFLTSVVDTVSVDKLIGASGGPGGVRTTNVGLNFEIPALFTALIKMKRYTKKER